MRFENKHHLSLVTRNRAIWYIRDVVNNYDPSVSEQKVQLDLVNQTLEAIPEDLQQAVIDHIVRLVPFSEDTRARGFKAEKTYLYLIAKKTNLLF